MGLRGPSRRFYTHSRTSRFPPGRPFLPDGRATSESWRSREGRSDVRAESWRLAAVDPRALQPGWRIPAEMRQKVVAVLCEITSDATARPRERTAVARALLQASRVDLDAIRAAQEAQDGDLAGRLRALEERADAGPADATGGFRGSAG